MANVRRQLLALAITALCGACARDVDAAASAPIASDVLGDEWQHLGANTARVSTARKWDGSLDGPVTFWHPSGVKMGEGSYQNDEKHGAWTFWHPNGGVRWQGAFDRGVPSGEQRAWHENGQPHYVGTWRAGRREGEFKAWHANGRTAWQAHYRRGKPEGELRSWNEDGELDGRVSGTYREGRKVDLASGAANLAARAR